MDAKQRNRRAWEANAAAWDARMADEGNDFVNQLQWPVIEPLLELRPGSKALDIACGNGLFSRRMARLGADVTAFDFSAVLLERAQARTPAELAVRYLHLDATDHTALETALQPLGPFDAALCNMALFDIADIEPLFTVLPALLRRGAPFVFSLLHPAFNNPATVKLSEEWDDGQLHRHYAVKISRYITPFVSPGQALAHQPEPQLYFHRPLQDYLQAGFRHGFVVDGFAEPTFPPGEQSGNSLSWGPNFSEIPPLIVIRMRHG